MKRFVLIILLAAILAAGCTSPEQAPAAATQISDPNDSANNLFSQAEKAFAYGNYHTAGDLYFSRMISTRQVAMQSVHAMP